MADPTPLPQKSPTVPTHAQIIAQPSLETYLVDGGINVVAGIAILIFGWWLATRAAVLTRRALDRLHHFDETLKPLVASRVVGTGEAWLTELSNDELRDLFALRQEALGE